MIESQALTFTYAQGPRLEFPDVRIAQGGVLLLSGASGCGKSTWLALVAALVRPGSGSLVVAGQDIAALSPAQADAWRARNVGFLPQKLHLSPALTVQQNLALAYWAASEAHNAQRIAATLDALGVAELAQRKPAQLSGGQAQRVALARAVLQAPRVLLADEPTASLDDEAAADAVALLQATSRSQGATLVIATHDARVATLLGTDLGGESGFQALRLVRNTLANSEQVPAPAHGGAV